MVQQASMQSYICSLREEVNEEENSFEGIHLTSIDNSSLICLRTCLLESPPTSSLSFVLVSAQFPLLCRHFSSCQLRLDFEIAVNGYLERRKQYRL